jgi:hypothetical protein
MKRKLQQGHSARSVAAWADVASMSSVLAEFPYPFGESRQVVVFPSQSLGGFLQIGSRGGVLGLPEFESDGQFRHL